MTSHIFGGAGLAAGVTVGALLAQDKLGGAQHRRTARGTLTLGSAAVRRPGPTLGFLADAVGASGIVVAVVVSSSVVLVVLLFTYSSGTATNLQARYAGADLAPAHRRATAVSVAMVCDR